MAINFPANPSINDTFIVSGTIFTWTGVKWKSTAVTEISSDTSPELGGELDLNNAGITGTGNINVTGIITSTSFSGNGANLTSLSSAQLTGALPAIDGSNLVSGRWTLGANGTSDYTFTGIGFTQTTNDPTLYLKRGEVYEFVNNSGGSHPFQIRESNGGAAYNNGVTNNGAASGTITFAVPYNAPDTLYYQCMNHSGMFGTIKIFDRSIPVNAHSAASYTLTLSDVGGCVREATSGANITVPADVFSAGDAITIFNISSGNNTITQGSSTTLYNAADGTTGNRTLAAKGVATILCTASNEFVVSGAQLT